MTHTPPQGSEEPTFYLNAMAPKRRRTGLIVGLVAAGVLVVAAGAGGIGYALASGKEPAASAAAATPAPTTPVAAAGPTGPWSPPPPTDVSVSFGDTLRITSSDGAEFHYTVVAAAGPVKSKYGMKAEKGSFYGIQVTVEVIAGSTYVCACDYALIAQDGTATEGKSVGFTGGLEAVEVNRGQKAAGLVVFDIPVGAERGGKIELRDGGRSQNQGFWRIP